MDNDTVSRGALLSAVRLSRGLTQQELAAAAETSQASVSKAEAGKDDLDLERWAALERCLAVPRGTFLRVQPPVPESRIFHRKLRSTPQSALKRLRAEVDLASLRSSALLSARKLDLRVNRHPIPDDGFITPGEIADEVRQELRIADGPIGNMTRILEDSGVVVIRSHLEAMQVDAIAGWPEGGIPIILLNDRVSAERQRFTLAHELGHAVMHDTAASALHESQADAFASAFLMPADSFAADWPGRQMDSLVAYKSTWGVSFAAAIRRGRDLGLLSESDYTKLSIHLSATGAHRLELNPMNPERPTLVADAIESAMAQGATLQALAERALMLEDEFVSTYLENRA